jgi:hypothetical protein
MIDMNIAESLTRQWKSSQGLHHAYTIQKSNTGASDLLLFFEKTVKISLASNPDFFHERFEVFSIDDARRIKEIHESRSFSEGIPRIFLIEAFTLNREAQNALLKVLEEPKLGNHFFLVVSSFDIFLPTLRSRLHFLENTNSGKEKEGGANPWTKAAEDFLKFSPKERIAYVDGLAGSISDKEVSKQDALFFLNALERFLYEKAEKKTPSVSQTLETIASARMYMSDRSASVKMLLEQVALSL